MLQVGIVGLPNVGKSTLFSALTKKQVDCENFPFCTIEPNVGVVEVPDKRVDELARISGSEKKIPTAIEFVDIAGLVKGAHKGEGLGNKFLSNIRETDMILHVVRSFEHDDVHHVDGSIDPKRDAEVIEMELVMADLATVEKRLESIERKAISTKDKDLQTEVGALKVLKKALDAGELARSVELSDEQKETVKDTHLLTQKPMLYVVNASEDKIGSDEWKSPLEDARLAIPLSIKMEADIAALGKDEAELFLNELGWSESGLDKVIRTCYGMLNLITFLTTGEKETRAWTVEKGAAAPQAAGKIHTDFEKGFIRAETVAYDEFVRHGGWAGARDAGVFRVEGKEYVVQDGDVMLFRFS